MEQASLVATLVLVSSVLLVGCRDAGVRPGTTASDEPSPAASSRATPTSANLAPEEAPRLVGRVMAGAGTPVAGEPFVVVDRTGRVFAGRTGARGEAEVAGVVTPYDLRVRDRGYLGVTRTDPLVELEAEGPAMATTDLEVEVHAPPCGREPCIVEVASRSVTGSGRATGFGVPTVVAVSHRFADEMADIEIHVLVHDAAFTTVAYARAFEVLGRVRLDARPVDTREVNVEDDTTITLDVPGGESFVVKERLPLLDDASFRIERRATAPPTSTTLHRSSRAWSGSLALDSESPALPLPAGPTLAPPRASGFTWDADPNTLFTLDVVEVARGASRYRLVTSEAAVSAARLARLGFAALAPGGHTCSLETAPRATVDEALSPDPEARARRLDVRRAGASTSEIIPFTVSP